MTSYVGQIDSFRGDFRFLSNFYPAQVPYGGYTYPTVENAYQASKTYNAEIRAEFVNMTPAESKKFGKLLELTDDWDEIKLEVMQTLLRHKFSWPELSELLKLTDGYELIEGNWWGDTFWGVCNGKGHNHLGRLLMDTRDWLDTDRIF